MAILRGIHLEYTGKGVLSVRNWRKVMKQVFLRIGQHWAKKMLPGHFEHQAHAKYGYQTRSQNWIRRKIAMLARGQGVGVQDLVQTGNMRDWVLSTVQVTAGPTAAHVHAGGPDYLKINPAPAKRSGRTMPNMVNEISALTDEERQELTQVGNDAVWEAWDALPEQTERSETNVSVAGYFHEG